MLILLLLLHDNQLLLLLLILLQSCHHLLIRHQPQLDLMHINNTMMLDLTGSQRSLFPDINQSSSSSFHLLQQLLSVPELVRLACGHVRHLHERCISSSERLELHRGVTALTAEKHPVVRFRHRRSLLHERKARLPLVWLLSSMRRAFPCHHRKLLLLLVGMRFDETEKVFGRDGPVVGQAEKTVTYR